MWVLDSCGLGIRGIGARRAGGFRGFGRLARIDCGSHAASYLRRMPGGGDNMSSIPPPTGLPFGTGVAFDASSVLAAVTALVMLAGLALLLWAVRARDRVTYTVRCPIHGTEAVIRVCTPRGDRRADV